jgi:hypothetical protein
MTENETKMTETCGIIWEFDEWLQPKDIDVNPYYKVAKNLIEYTRQLRHYFDGFLLVPVAMYKGEVITAKSLKTDTLGMYEVVEFLKGLKQNNKMVFLYAIEENSNCFIIRYGVL